MQQLLNTESIISSLEIALSMHFDYAAASRRLNGSVSGFAPGSLNIKRRGSCICLAEYHCGKQSFVSKKSDRAYELARRKYISLLLHAMKCFEDQSDTSLQQRQDSLAELSAFINLLDSANLDAARVVLTAKQYEWFTKTFKQKANSTTPAIYTEGGIRMRSKSEKDIGNELENCAVPFHFEEALRINVKFLVNTLAENLNLRPKNGSLFQYIDGSCYWNVPPQLEWMNSDGSLWRSYDSRSGTITIYPDFRIMLADGSFLFWEHEGLMEKFIYRSNASEREAIMRYAGNIPFGNLITTFEKDTLDSARLSEIVRNEILPRLFW